MDSLVYSFVYFCYSAVDSDIIIVHGGLLVVHIDNSAEGLCFSTMYFHLVSTFMMEVQLKCTHHIEHLICLYMGEYSTRHAVSR